MKVREARPSDFRDMTETYFSFFAEVVADPSFGLLLYKEKPSMDDERKWFKGKLKSVGEGNTVMLVAEVDSHVVGWCTVERMVPKTPADHRGSLGICVKKDSRGRGIGTALLKAIIMDCKGKFEFLELTVLSSNRSAIRLYRRFGFRRMGVRHDAVKRAGRYFDEDLMDMKL